ncbi:hypothetical protein TURU_048157 [Turdus rufiventris]|nr:hypothetical protein TURU_048157 [Turdus rufiventris]
MKRRSADCSKLRRPLKRNRITEGIYGSTFLYLKFLVVWALVLLADFVLEFRFEYLWPFWLFIRSVYDSFRYQGLAFSVFFVCVAFTSNIICLLFIPIQWLFFAASTYVWVQYVWHTAAKGLSDMDSSILLQHNGGIPANKKISATLPELEYREKGKEKDKDAKKHNLGINNNILQPVDSKIQEIEYMENHINSKRLNNDLVGSTENLLKEDSCTASSKNYKNVSGVVNSSPRSHSASNGSIPSSSSKNEKKQKCASKSPSTHKDFMENCIPNNQLSKPDALVRVKPGCSCHPSNIPDYPSNIPAIPVTFLAAALGNLLDLEDPARTPLGSSESPELDNSSFGPSPSVNNNVVWGTPGALARPLLVVGQAQLGGLAQSRTNPQVLDTGLTAQDMQSAETLSPVDWNQMEPSPAEKDELFMF